MTESHMHIQDIKSSPSLTGHNNSRTYVFHQVEFVDKNNLKGQNHRRDTSTASFSAGLVFIGQYCVPDMECGTNHKHTNFFKLLLLFVLPENG